MVSFSIFKGKEEAQGLKRVKDLCFIESATNFNSPKCPSGNKY